jgi:hypothetical protein
VPAENRLIEEIKRFLVYSFVSGYYIVMKSETGGGK